MITAEIKIDQDIDEIEKAIKPEITKQNRSTIEIEKNEKLIFKIKAQDAVAFRATMNSLTQMLSVFYKMKRIK